MHQQRGLTIAGAATVVERQSRGHSVASPFHILKMPGTLFNRAQPEGDDDLDCEETNGPVLWLLGNPRGRLTRTQAQLV